VAPFLPGFESQFKIDFYAIDFADPLRKIAVEVQGCWHHCCQQCFPGSPSFSAQRLTLANDKRKHSYLSNRGWRVIYLWEHNIRSHPETTVTKNVQNRKDVRAVRGCSPVKGRARRS
jgi:very-short-patch-repair endonuclease